VHPAQDAQACVLSCPAGGRVIDAWAPVVTHVVCAVNENREARRTLKYMQVRHVLLAVVWRGGGMAAARVEPLQADMLAQ
jgi:hypothetical protein